MNIDSLILEGMINDLEPVMHHFESSVLRNNSDLLVNIFHLNLEREKVLVNINNIFMQFAAEDYWLILNDNETTLTYMSNSTPVFDPFLNFIYSHYTSSSKPIMVIDGDDMEIYNTQWKLNKILYTELQLFIISDFKKTLYVPKSVIYKIDLIRISNFFRKLFDSSNVNVLT